MVTIKVRDSLLKYDDPIESEIGDESSPSTKLQFSILSKTLERTRGHLPNLESKPTNEDILSAILPPREWVENGKDSIDIRNTLYTICFP